MSLPSVASQRITEFYENNNLTIESALKGLQSLNLNSNPPKSIAAKTEMSYNTALSTQVYLKFISSSSSSGSGSSSSSS